MATYNENHLPPNVTKHYDTFSDSYHYLWHEPDSLVSIKADTVDDLMKAVVEFLDRNNTWASPDFEGDDDTTDEFYKIMHNQSKEVKRFEVVDSWWKSLSINEREFLMETMMEIKKNDP